MDWFQTKHKSLPGGHLLTRLLFLLCSLHFAHTMQAQPNWTINYPAYQYTMTFTGIITLDYLDSANPNDIIGAFINDSCRGVASPVLNASLHRYFVDMVIYSNDYSAPIKFKVWSSDKKSIIDIEKSSSFEINKISGSVEHPWYWSSPALSSSAKFISFTMDGQIGETTLTDSTVSLNFPADFLLGDRTATFEVPKRSIVKVNKTVQISGETMNNFTDTLVYKVIAADETDSINYNVISNRAAPLLLDATNTITPNGDGINDYWIIHNIELFADYELQIFSSRGLRVYKASNYKNDWNGEYQGQKLPSGVYHFILKKGNKNQSGSISIIR